MLEHKWDLETAVQEVGSKHPTVLRSTARGFPDRSVKENRGRAQGTGAGSGATGGCSSAGHESGIKRKAYAGDTPLELTCRVALDSEHRLAQVR